MTAPAAAPTFEVFTLFPAAIAGFLQGGLVGKAAQSGRVAVHCTDYREFAHPTPLAWPPSIRSHPAPTHRPRHVDRGPRHYARLRV